jgi:AcrR family transcriptional regulator
MSQLGTAVPASMERARRHMSSRQAVTVQRLVEATLQELRECGYGNLTLRNVARRAGVAPATAYTHFASREHLVTELFWRRLSALPEASIDQHTKASVRASTTLGEIALLVADEPELAEACTVAMLAANPDVKVLRDRIGWEMNRRLAAALGDDSDPAVLRALELALSGAMVKAGMGHLSYADLPSLLAEVTDLVMTQPR